MSLATWLSSHWFGLIHGHNLVYNACWEDPRLDRAALRLGPNDTVAVITSAGCNALDYVLAGAKHVHAVDVNARQNALLELKLAGIRRLDFDTFFAMFGRGLLGDFPATYRASLRPVLSRWARAYWDRHLHYFNGAEWRRSFYFHGTAGLFARAINFYVDRIAKVRDAVTALLHAPTVDQQRDIYDRAIRGEFWKNYLKWLMRRDAALSLLGVPRGQRLQVERQYAGGMFGFLQDCCEAVFARLPLGDNYFWRVYLTGQYTPDCCPEYLRKENFERLKAGLVDRLTLYTGTLLDFLTRHEGRISRFVLLDHMDWLAARRDGELEREWQAIVRRAAPGTRCIWRSSGLSVDYVDPLSVWIGRTRQRLGDLLSYDWELAATLHARDRVHTYGSFHVADLAV